MGCAVVAWRRRECSKEWSLLVMALTCPAYRCRKQLRLRKENGTRACRETSGSRAPQPRGRAQSKVCVVKAVLPQSQFPVAKGLAVANTADTLCHAGPIAPASANCHQFAWWVKETNGTPKHTATPTRVTTGSPSAGSFEDLYGNGAVIVPKCPAQWPGQPPRGGRSCV
jgi:hypothetical protein